MRRDEVRLSVTLRSSLRFAATVALGAFAAALAASGGAAQPAPSFEAPCGEVRDALAKLAPDDEEIVTIAVRGQLTAVRSDGALVYLFLCSAPDPRILCVTYETNGVVEGDQVIVTGNLIPRGPDHIQLDPCLHHRAE